MKPIGYIILLSFIGSCLGAGGSVGGGSGSGGVDLEGSLVETEDTRLYREGLPLTLTCKHNETKLKTEWTKDGKKIENDDHYELFENSSLYISSLKETDIGEYDCTYFGREEPKTFNVVQLLLHKHLPKSTTILENDKLKLSCEVQGNPHPNVQWLKNGEALETENTTRIVFEENAHEVPNATLLIKPVIESDKGNYICLITQYSLNVNTTTEVRVKDIYAALWPFLGIVVEVTILCALIFLYEKRRIKVNLDAADLDEMNEQRNGDHGKDSEVRQRK